MNYLDLKKCYYCESYNIPLNKDHIIPKSIGGRLLVSSCFNCNNLKSNLSLFEFYLLGRIDEKVFIRMVNFLKVTKYEDYYNKLFSLNEFKRKIKNNSFNKLIDQNLNTVIFNIQDNPNDYFALFNEIIYKLKNSTYQLFSLDDYFIKIIKITPSKLIRKLNLTKYRKLFKINSENIKQELLSDIQKITSNYDQITRLIKTDDLLINLETLFVNKINYIYSNQYILKIIILLKRVFLM